MAKQLDLVNRDPNNMNYFIQVDNEDVLAEPNGAHSSDW
jgi:caveolin 1